MTLRPKFRHWANCNCKYDKLYSTVGGKPLLGCRTRRIPSEPRQSVLVILQERMAIYLKIYVLHGPVRDSCTRAHGKLVTPLCRRACAEKIRVRLLEKPEREGSGIPILNPQFPTFGNIIIFSF